MEVTRKRKILFGAATGIVVGFLYAAGSRLDRYDTLNLLEASFLSELAWTQPGRVTDYIGDLVVCGSAGEKNGKRRQGRGETLSPFSASVLCGGADGLLASCAVVHSAGRFFL